MQWPYFYQIGSYSKIMTKLQYWQVRSRPPAARARGSEKRLWDRFAKEGFSSPRTTRHFATRSFFCFSSWQNSGPGVPLFLRKKGGRKNAVLCDSGAADVWSFEFYLFLHVLLELTVSLVFPFSFRFQPGD